MDYDVKLCKLNEDSSVSVLECPWTGFISYDGELKDLQNVNGAEYILTLFDANRPERTELHWDNIREYHKAAGNTNTEYTESLTELKIDSTKYVILVHKNNAYLTGGPWIPDKKYEVIEDFLPGAWADLSSVLKDILDNS